MPDEFVYLSLFYIFLYAETHYRFRYFFSWLRKSEPEIVADIPSRILHGTALPVMIIIKDADKYPVRLESIEASCNNSVIKTQKPEERITVPYYEYIFDIDTLKMSPGANAINIKIKYHVKGNSRFCVNDNYRGTSHAPLPLYISDAPLPRIDDAVLGEPHAHTNFTSDQVEFGASVGGTARLAEAMGLDFYCATDHSYDLDDMPDNYLVNDPELKKWHNFLNEVDEYNSQKNNFVVIPGEEVSIRNHNGRNVHCLVYNSPEFFPGSGDSAEKWFRWKSELSLEELTSLVRKGAYIFAAHPFEDSPYLQKLFIGRDRWTDVDCTHEHIHGLQFINGTLTHQTDQAIKEWIKFLLQGFRITGIAGNDAHGNFARFRQVGFPFFTMRENYEHLFGKWFTGVYGVESGSKEEILTAMAAGKCYMSNGPAIQFLAKNKETGWEHTGIHIANPEKLRVHVKSSLEFGRLKSINILCGDHQKQTERINFTNNILPEYEYLGEIDFKPDTGTGYLRAEITTESNHQALSNPIWFYQKTV